MKLTPMVRMAAGLVGLTVMATSLSVSPALAQSADCTCVLPAGSGGAISSINPDVFVAGTAGAQVASVGTRLGAGSVVTTGPSGRAGIDLGNGCRFSMAGSMSMQIVPQQGGLCVQVLDQSVTSPMGGGAAAAAGIAVGGGVLVSLGFLASVSK